MDDYPLSPGRVRFNQIVTDALDTTQLALVRHWLAAVNVSLVVALVLPILAPALMKLGYPQLAHPIYWLYQAICHQWPFRTFFLFGPQPTYASDQIVALAGQDELWTLVGTPELGFKMAFCERDLAIVAAGLLIGLMYTRVRGRLAPPTIPFYVALLLPIMLDGFTQFAGLRESTWEYRLATGAIAGAATVWLVFPYLDLLASRWLAAISGSAAPPPLPDPE